MKQMICLMSEQLIPSYLAVKHHKPDRVWRILTDVTRKAGRDRMFCETLIEHGGFGQLDTRTSLRLRSYGRWRRHASR